jgi:ubiquinol-cytochrome c reductase cytochrome c subunit
MTGLHGLHVFLGLVAMVFLLGRMKGRRGVTPASSPWSRGSATTGTSSTSSGSGSSVACSSSSRHARRARTRYRRHMSSPHIPACPGPPGHRRAGRRWRCSSPAPRARRRPRRKTSSAPTTSTTSRRAAPVNLKGVTGGHNRGTPSRAPSSSASTAMLIRYGNSAITYANPPASYAAAGKLLFDQTCSSCHGSRGQRRLPDGQATIGPNLQGVGAATVDFWVTTGRMPATDVAAVEAERKPPRLTDKQALEVAAYINSLDPSVPGRAHPAPEGGQRRRRRHLFSLNCAACHTITGPATPWPSAPTPRRCRTGRSPPSRWPRPCGSGRPTCPGSRATSATAQVRDVVAYVTEKIQHPTNPGGPARWRGPGGRGLRRPALGVGGLALICFWIGERS